MGTHPISESDFDCLTDMPDRLGGGGSSGGGFLSKPINFVTEFVWSFINFVIIFFSTMLNLKPPEVQNNSSRSGGRSGGPGGGPGDKKGFRGMGDITKKSGPRMNVGGGGVDEVDKQALLFLV